MSKKKLSRRKFMTAASGTAAFGAGWFLGRIRTLDYKGQRGVHLIYAGGTVNLNESLTWNIPCGRETKSVNEEMSIRRVNLPHSFSLNLIRSD